MNYERFNPVTDYDFSQAERDAIQTSIEKDFAAFDFSFVQSVPESGDFSILYFNDGPDGGLADALDFRNQNRNDRARINTSQLVGLADDFLALTSFIGSHELGHILGLRHRDSLGPIGSGFASDPNFLFGNGSAPFYTGPYEADTTVNHIIETGITQNMTPWPTEKFFGHREAIKLSFNERGTTLAEADLTDVIGSPFVQSPRQIDLYPLDVPNTVESGLEASQSITVEAVAITGSISAALQKDYFAFEGSAGDLMTIEAISGILGPDPNDTNEGSERYTQVIDPRVALYDSSGEFVDYFGQDAVNRREFESDPFGFFPADAILLDLVLPADGTYYVEVLAEGFGDVGNYELFMHRFSAVQFPSGDFNNDGLVDAADYTIWRDTNGDDVTPGTGADLDGNGKIDENDRDLWANGVGSEPSPVITPAHIAAGFGTSSSLTVPEPSTVLLASIALAGLAARRR